VRTFVLVSNGEQGTGKHWKCISNAGRCTIVSGSWMEITASPNRSSEHTCSNSRVLDARRETTRIEERLVTGRRVKSRTLLKPSLTNKTGEQESGSWVLSRSHDSFDSLHGL
jgi:hypothetical protein